MNSMDAAFRLWGFMAAVAILAGLVANGAWGALAFVAVGVPIIGWAEHRMCGSRG